YGNLRSVPVPVPFVFPIFGAARQFRIRSSGNIGFVCSLPDRLALLRGWASMSVYVHNAQIRVNGKCAKCTLWLDGHLSRALACGQCRCGGERGEADEGSLDERALREQATRTRLWEARP